MINHSEWAHHVRDALRKNRWKGASARRMDMRGIEIGIDRDATNKEWKTLG